MQETQRQVIGLYDWLDDLYSMLYTEFTAYTAK